MRGILTGQLDPDTLSRDEFKNVTDLCVNCQMCRLECPASVDIPRLMLEGKAAYVAGNGLRFADWRCRGWNGSAAIGSFFGPLANWALSNRQARWLLEKGVGIAQARKLPRVTSRSFVRRALAPQADSTDPKQWTQGAVLCRYVCQLSRYATGRGPGVRLGAQRRDRLCASGADVIGYVGPVGWRDRSGTHSRRHNVPLLAEAVRQGYHIVTTEPAAALCLTCEYQAILDDDEARLVAENTSEACAYLWKLHLAGTLQLDLKPINATLGYHLPCHLKALDAGTPGMNLLRLIPALNVSRIERGCSGHGGNVWPEQQNFRNSLRAGWGLISGMGDESLQAGTTECSSCKMQMEQGTTKPTLHPIKPLALAYGLMPQVARQLTTREEELIVS